MSERRHDDVLDRLKHKEDEMEAQIQEARTRASSIKDEALKKVREIKSARQNELDSEIEKIVASRTGEIDAEVAGIEEQALTDAEELRDKGLKRADEAVLEGVRFIMEGVCD
jgi:vacuolar-type H+-ATPase subunit H